MKKFLALLLVLAPLCVSAQTTHTFPALDTENVFTGNNTFFRLIPPHGPVIGEPPLPLLWTVYVATDGASGSDCTVGGGTDQHWCGWTGVAWVPLGGTGGGGGGATPCGAANDVQTTDGNGNFTCDTGIFEEFANTHTLDVWIGNFAQEVQISDPGHTGLADFGHSNGSVVDAHFKQSLASTFSTTNSGYGINWPDSPAAGALTITSLTPAANGLLPTTWSTAVSGLVSCEDWFPVWHCNANYPATTTDITPSANSFLSNLIFASPIVSTDPAASLVQATNPGQCVIASVGTVACSINAITPGDTLIFVSPVQCGLGCSGITFAPSDTLTNTWHSAFYSDGSGSSLPLQISYAPITHGGNDTVTVVAAPTGANYNTQVQVFEVKGTAIPDVIGTEKSSVSPTSFTFNSITTTHASDFLLACVFQNDAATTYTQGSTWYLNPQMYGGLAPFASMGCEVQNVASTGVQAPTMTGSGGGSGYSIVTSWQITAPTGFGTLSPRWWRYQDGVAGGDLPDSAGQNGKALVATSTPGKLAFAAAALGTVTSIATTAPLSGGPITTTGTIACATCTVTVCSGTITLNPGATSSNTCSSAATGTCTGLATTDNIMVDFNADPTSTTGYSPGSMGTIAKYPTSNTVNVKYCNNTSGSLTPTSITLNYRAVR